MNEVIEFLEKFLSKDLEECLLHNGDSGFDISALKEKDQNYPRVCCYWVKPTKNTIISTTNKGRVIVEEYFKLLRENQNNKKQEAALNELRKYK